MKFYERAALFLAFVGCATSLKCYTCTDTDLPLPTDTSACRDPFDRNATHPFVEKVDCAYVSQVTPVPEAFTNAGLSKFDTCLKFTNTEKTINVLSRTCYDSSHCPGNGCFSNRGVTVCCCNTDYCNDGAALAFSRAVILTVVFVAFSLTA